MFWSEIGSGFEEPGDTPLPRIPRSTPPPPPPAPPQIIVLTEQLYVIPSRESLAASINGVINVEEKSSGTKTHWNRAKNHKNHTGQTITDKEFRWGIFYSKLVGIFLKIKKIKKIK